jgi:hypothetical protein
MDYNKITATWWSGNCYHIEQLNAIISSTDIKAYAYILHDKDKVDTKDPNNELKKPHYHFLIQFTKNQRGSWFKQFNTDDMGIVFIQTCHDPQSAFNYLIHDTPTAHKQCKYPYDPSERISTIENFETVEKPDENIELFNDIMEMLYNKMTWREFIQKKPKRIHMITNIRVAFETIFFETYGHRYCEIFPKFNKHELPPKINSVKQELPPPKIEIVPLPKDTELPW